MFLYKQSLINLILIIFSVYCTGILATDCDVYKDIVGSSFPYKDDLYEVNGNCCRLHQLSCDDQSNIISVDFFFLPDCGVKTLFEKLANLPKLNSVKVDMDDQDIPSTVEKLTQIKELTISYPFYNKNHHIPSSLGTLVNLEELTLSRSELAGTIPSSLGNLVNLKSLDLSNNHLEGYIPYEFKNLKKLQNLHLSGNKLNGFVPPISSLSSCDIQYNEGMCYLKSSKCRSDLKECTLDQIKTTNKNNGNPDPDSGEFENEKDYTLTTNDNSGNSGDNRSSYSGSNSNDDSDYYSGSYMNNEDNQNDFLITFIIVVVVGVIIIAVIFVAIYIMGNRKPKFSEFKDNDNESNYNHNIISGDPADDNEINNINNSTSYSTTATVQPVAGSNYNYVPTPSPALTPVQMPVSSNGYSTYYPVSSPVPSAAQPSPYISPNPATPYVIPVSQPEVAYINPVQTPQQIPTYVPSQASSYAMPQTSVPSQVSSYAIPQTSVPSQVSSYAIPQTSVPSQVSSYTVPQTSTYVSSQTYTPVVQPMVTNPPVVSQTNPPTEAQPMVTNPPVVSQTNPPTEAQPEMAYPLPLPEGHRLPDDELPPYESLSRSLGRQIQNRNE